MESENNNILDDRPATAKSTRSNKFLVFGLFLAIPNIFFALSGFGASYLPMTIGSFSIVLKHAVPTIILSVILTLLKRNDSYISSLAQAFFYVSLGWFFIQFGPWILGPLLIHKR